MYSNSFTPLLCGHPISPRRPPSYTHNAFFPTMFTPVQRRINVVLCGQLINLRINECAPLVGFRHIGGSMNFENHSSQGYTIMYGQLVSERNGSCTILPPSDWFGIYGNGIMYGWNSDYMKIGTPRIISINETNINKEILQSRSVTMENENGVTMENENGVQMEDEMEDYNDVQMEDANDVLAGGDISISHTAVNDQPGGEEEQQIQMTPTATNIMTGIVQSEPDSNEMDSPVYSIYSVHPNGAIFPSEPQLLPPPSSLNDGVSPPVAVFCRNAYNSNAVQQQPAIYAACLAAMLCIHTDALIVIYHTSISYQDIYNLCQVQGIEIKKDNVVVKNDVNHYQTLINDLGKYVNYELVLLYISTHGSDGALFGYWKGEDEAKPLLSDEEDVLLQYLAEHINQNTEGMTIVLNACSSVWAAVRWSTALKSCKQVQVIGANHNIITGSLTHTFGVNDKLSVSVTSTSPNDTEQMIAFIRGFKV